MSSLFLNYGKRVLGWSGGFMGSGSGRAIGMRRLLIVMSLFVRYRVPSSLRQRRHCRHQTVEVGGAAVKVSCESIFDPAAVRFIVSP